MFRPSITASLLSLSLTALIPAAAFAAGNYNAYQQLSGADTSGPWSANYAGGFGGYGTYRSPSQSAPMTAHGYSQASGVYGGQNYVYYEGNSWSGGTQLSIGAGMWRNTSFGDHDYLSQQYGIHLSPGMVSSGYPYFRYDPVLKFAPTLTEATTFNIAFDIASDYDLTGAQDDAAGQYIALYHNDLVIDSDTYWPEDNNPNTGAVINTTSDPTGSNGDGWVAAPGTFARYDVPIQVRFQITMQPGDTLSFRVNSGVSNAYDGIFLPLASASVVPEPATLTLAAVSMLLLRRRSR